MWVFKLLEGKCLGHKGQFTLTPWWTSLMCFFKFVAWNILGQKGQCLRTLSWTSLMCRANLLRDISFPHWGHFSLNPEWTTCMCSENLDDPICFLHSCVAHVSLPNMAVYVNRIDHLVAVAALFLWPMDAFDVQWEIPRWTKSFPTLRTLVWHLRTSCSTWVVKSFLVKLLRIVSLHLFSSVLNGQPAVILNLRTAIWLRGSFFIDVVAVDIAIDSLFLIKIWLPWTKGKLLNKLNIWCASIMTIRNMLDWKCSSQFKNLLFLFLLQLLQLFHFFLQLLISFLQLQHSTVQELFICTGFSFASDSPLTSMVELIFTSGGCL